MDIQPQNQQPISDDQELAKVLAGVSQQADDAASTPAQTVDDLPTPLIDDDEAAPAAPAIEEPAPAVEPDVPVAAYDIPAPAFSAPVVATTSTGLEAIKQEALGELRPLVDKLDVSPEEKFDTYLLLLRSTDDQALVGPAHEAARGITDEARRAQALLDIIKEIDFLSGPQQ